MRKNIIHTIKFILVLILAGSNLSSYAKLDLSGLGNKSEQNYPSADQAFTINSFIKNKTEVQILMSAIDNTYVYQNSFKFTTNNTKIALRQAQYPESKTIVDEHYGETQVFTKDFEIILPYQSNTEQDFELTIEYQGCLKDVLCYPPKKKVFFLTAIASAQDALPKLEPVKSPVTAIEQQKQAIQVLTDAKILSVIGTFILFGLLLSLTPCVLPMLPILSGIIAGHKHNITKLHAFMLSFIYVLSMALTYMLAGIIVASAGINLNTSLQQPVIIISVSLLFIFLAIASFGFIELKLPSFVNQKLNDAQSYQKGGTYMGVAIMGILSALVISPCATAPLAGALMYISSTGNAWLGGIALFSMGFAMGTPILLFGTSAGHFLPKAGPWMHQINVFFGVVFIGMAIFLLSRIISGPLSLVLWGLLLIFYSVYLGLLEPAQHDWQRVQKGFALIFAIYGIFLLAGATQNQSDVFHPFGQNSSTRITHDYIDFKKIKSITELDASLQQAEISKKITVLDFYADWCSYCVSIEKNVFTDFRVKNILSKFNTLKVDVTHISNDDELLMSKLSVTGPPAIIFFDVNGKEIENSRIIGNINADSFYEIIKNIN